MQIKRYPVIIIGSGISGLYSALKIEQKINKPILLITKSELGESNSYYAQGGMVAVLQSNINDSVDLHVEDTIKAGAGLSEIDTVRFISEKSDAVVKDLLNFGVEFDRDKTGNFTLTKEAAHSVRRILHSGGDATGREIEKSLVKVVKSNKNIEVFENTIVVDLLVKNNICGGVVVLRNDRHEIIYSDAIILATGGLGQLYKYTTNPLCATGDGFALAYNAGAELRDMEFVQFHPTALAIDDPKNHNRFLISEAVRGEGAKLCDKNGIEYMEKYDSRKELAPRDIVARANFVEMQKNNVSNVFLNALPIGKDKLLQRFPTIAKKCMEYGIDITKDFIPVAPAAHYFMGGVKTNLKGETSVKNLYAVGEVSSTGLHGANRLASNSLLECVVCAFETASNILSKTNSYIQNDYQDIILKYENLQNEKISCNINDLIDELKTLMWENVGIFRSEKSLIYALDKITNIENKFPKKEIYNTLEEYNFRNMIITAKLIIKSALSRRESRGAHYRTDFLQTNKYAIHSDISKN